MGFYAIAMTAALLAAGPTASDVYMGQKAVIREIKAEYKSVQVHPVWIPCGELNSAYYPEEKAVVLCTEVADEPRVANFFAAHEMGHAVLMQLTGEESEEAADEFAVVELLEHGRVEDVMGAASWMMEQEPQGRESLDGHPSWAYRTFNMLCMLDGYLNVNPNPACRMLWLGTEYRWKSRLEIDQFRTMLRVVI